MKRRGQDGSHVLALGLAILVVGIVGLVGWRVLGNKTKPNSNQSLSAGSKQNQTSQDSPEQNELIWQQTADGWQSTKTPPACPNPLTMQIPVDISTVTSILYPGQIRGGNYKPHGGFRFDKTSNDKITVKAPIDAFLVRGGRYLAEGEVQYTFDAMNNCGVMYRVGHLRVLPANLQKIADTWPEAREGDSRTQQIMPAVLIKRGETLATTVGIVKDKNAFFDWGVYDYRKTNDASKSATYQQQHTQDKELAWHALCWFDLLGSKDSATVKSLPAGDSTSGKNSDYCK